MDLFYFTLDQGASNSRCGQACQLLQSEMKVAHFPMTFKSKKRCVILSTIFLYRSCMDL